jgi:GH24 family phage-related lysozyme (muramidase)
MTDSLANNEQKAKNWIEKWEGRREIAYDDKTSKPITPGTAIQGHPTVGVGFNLDRADAASKINALGLDYERVRSGDQTLNNEQIDRLLEADVKKAVSDARSIVPNFDSLSEDRQIVLTDMAFNLGRGKLSKFEETISAVQKGDWEKAADEMQNSKWFKDVKNRGEVNVDIMRGNSSIDQHLRKDVKNPEKLNDDIMRGDSSIDQHSAHDRTQVPTTKNQQPSELEQQKIYYQECYEQRSRKIIENSEFAGASPRDIDLGVAVSILKDREGLPGNLNWQESRDDIARVLSQSTQVREWKDSLDTGKYLEASNAYIQDIQNSANEIYQQHLDRTAEQALE